MGAGAVRSQSPLPTVPSSDYEVESYLESENHEGDNGTETERIDVADSLTDHSVTLKERRILKERFKILNGDQESTVLDSEAFGKEIFTSNAFCKHLVKKQLLLSKSPPPGAAAKGQQDHTTISYDTFSQKLTSWQNSTTDEKLEIVFQIVRTSSCISPEVLWRVLSHVIPNHTEEEYQLLARAMINIMTKESDSNGKLSSEQFKSWIVTHIPEHKLIESLDFKITNFEY